MSVTSIFRTPLALLCRGVGWGDLVQMQPPIHPVWVGARTARAPRCCWLCCCVDVFRGSSEGRVGVPPDSCLASPPLVLLYFFVVAAGYREDLPGHPEVRHRRGARLFPQRGHPQLHDPQDGQVGQLRSELRRGKRSATSPQGPWCRDPHLCRPRALQHVSTEATGATPPGTE